MHKTYLCLTAPVSTGAFCFKLHLIHGLYHALSSPHADHEMVIYQLYTGIGSKLLFALGKYRK